MTRRQQSRVEFQLCRLLVAHAFQLIDPVFELLVADPRLRLVALGKVGLGNLHRMFDDVDERFPVARAVILRNALDVRQVADLRRLLLRNIEHCFVADDLERRAVGGPRKLIAPLVEITNDGQSPSIEVAEVFQFAPTLVFFLACVAKADVLQARKFLLGPLPTSRCIQLVAQFLCERDEVPGVHRRILEHLRRERSHRPVGALMRLVHLQAEVAVEQRGQSECLVAEELGGDHRIDEVCGGEAEVAIEDAQVVVGTVQDLRDGRIGQHVAEPFQVHSGQRIDHQILAAGRDLDQTHLIEIRVQRIRLRIDGDDRLRRDAVQRLIQWLLLIDPDHELTTNCGKPIETRRSL